MKLKRFLAGAIAAAVTITTLAFASLTTAFADAETVTINSITYNFTVTNDATSTVTFTNQNTSWASFTASVDVDGNGSYSATTTGMSASGLTNLGYIEATAATTLTVDTIVINDMYTLDVGVTLNSSSSTGNGMANIWNDEGKADVVYSVGINADGTYTGTLVGDGGSSITFEVAKVVTEEPITETTEASSEVEENSFNEALCFADSDWYPTTMDGSVGVMVNSDGTYTILWDVSEYGGISDALIFCIDLYDASTNHPNMSAELNSIMVDGKSVAFDASKIIYGDIEENGNYRIEIYNTYGDSAADPGVDPDDIYAEETLSITFSVSGLSTGTTDEPVDPDVIVNITADTETAYVGDEVTYTLSIIPNQQLGTLQMREDFPEGLEYVDGSSVSNSNWATELGWFGNQSSNILDYFTFIAALDWDFGDFTPGTEVVLGTFNVIATEEGEFTPAFKDIEFSNTDFEVLTYEVVGTAVTYTTKPVDTSALEAAIAQAEAINSSVYTDNSVAVLAATIKLSNVVLANTSSSQDDINSATTAIIAAIDALIYKDADYTAVEAALENVPADLTIYTDDTVAALNDAINAVDYTKNITEQADVDAMADAINAAIAALEEAVTTYSVAGTIYVSDSDTETTMTVTVTLDGDEVATVEALSMGTYTIEGLEAGTYTITISGGKYAPRSYEVEVSEALSQDVYLNPYGDVNGDGKVTTADVGLANSHAKGVTTLTDYQYICADVNVDGNITTADVGKINSHAKNVSLLW
ncbi:MAG: dockerin type I repeat-containing protein [Ruminococcus sp.]|nr:dockerin type I repeat-containing protein [Ruminococcus sp.]